MTTALSDGPLGLEAKHLWNPAVGPAITINDLAGGLPRIKLKKITGLHDSPDADDRRENATAQLGEYIYPGYPRGKTVTYEGRLQAVDQPGLSALRTLFRAACWERNLEGFMRIEPHPDYGDVVWAYHARALDLSIDDEIPFNDLDNLPSDYQRDFILSVRMSDPRPLLWSEEQGSAEQASGATLTVDNRGYAQADPRIEVTAPGGVDITLENLSVNTSNGHARLRWLAVPAGLLVVEFARGARTATLDGDPVMNLFDSAWSQWWDELIPGLAPGDNDIKVTGGPWSITFRDRTV